MHRDSESDEAGRSVTVRITRWDLLWLHLGVISGWRGAWRGWLCVALGAGALAAWGQGLPDASRGWLVMTSAVLLATALASAAGVLVALGIVLFGANEVGCTLGEHTYTFDAEGLREQTAAGATLIPWGRVRAVRRKGRYILIHVAPGLYHALPRRSFASLGEYQAFWRDTQRLVGQGS